MNQGYNNDPYVSVYEGNKKRQNPKKPKYQNNNNYSETNNNQNPFTSINNATGYNNWNSNYNESNFNANNNIPDNNINVGNNYGTVNNDSRSLREKNNLRTRRILGRSVALSIIYTIISFGFYGWFWQFEIAKETNALTKDNKCATPALVVFLSIITLGIYQVYWSYQIGIKHNNFFARYDTNETSYNALFLVLMLLNYLFPFLIYVCYGIMQNNINKMIQIAEWQNPGGIFVKDSSIFNRPVWSTIILILIAMNIPQIIVSIYDAAFPFAGGNPGAISNAGDLINEAINSSAQQIVNADTPFMIFYSLLNIATIILVLWWFKLRFKHADYTGVLVLQNFGRACLFALPGLIFVGINLLDFKFENFKIGIVLLGFIPGFTEEITFRGMIVPNFLRIYNNSKGIWIALFVSAGIFGLIHLSNVFVGANLGTSVFQVFYAFGLGVLFAAILIRTGNLWPCIILHGLIDTFAMMGDEALKQGAVQTQEFIFGFGELIIIIVTVALVAYGFWVCRPKKHKEICELWADKWGDALC